MRAEIIAVGTEITSGMKLDTNSQWLSLQLAELGISTHFHTTVADDLDSNISVFRIAAQRADVVIITGGLGPTLDDLTRDALAEMAGVELEVDSDSLEHVEGFFRSRGRAMPERNRLQAMFPIGSLPLKNPIGTAPGIWMTQAREGQLPCYFAALPGVPSEMKKMYFEQVLPRLEDILPASKRMILRRARINCFGLGESQAEEMLGELTARGGDPDIGITAHEATITLRITSQGLTIEQCEEKVAVATQQIRERLGEFVFGTDDDELEHIVIRELTARHYTIATMECGTSGLLAERLAHVENAEHCYRGGTVLTRMIASPEILARQLQSEFDTDFVLFIGSETRTMQPTGHAIATIPLGLIDSKGEVQRLDLAWSGNPAITKSRAVKSVLNLLRLTLLRLVATS